MNIKVSVGKGYDIRIGKGVVVDEGLPFGFVISDENLFREYKKIIGDSYFLIKSGEGSKSLENYSSIVEELGDVDRIIAFGGGVVGDLAGFVASTYKRGVDLIQVPTSLLAMVDSSIGGKNGVNLREKKNYLGTVYQPEGVLIDPLFLEGLPKKEFRNGLAEVIKYGYLFDRPRLNRISRGINLGDNDLEKIIFDCCKAKISVVEKDEMDLGYRHVLNFGHTIGHAIELLYGLSHGEAVSVGMVKEAGLGYRLGIVGSERVEKLRDVLEVNGLPVDLPRDFDSDEVIDVMKFDKKGKFVFAFDGDNYFVEVDEAEVRRVLGR
jgi:3-dehydroquinate synthase